MEKLVRSLQQDYPALTFVVGLSFCWSPENNHIFYSVQNGEDGLLHEVGHALLGHGHYSSDLELLTKEVEAWQRAFTLAKHYGVYMNPEHAEDCLDTYRDWLHKRSLCPTCGSAGLQDSPERYQCLNCQNIWRVTAARFCRPYRRSKVLEKQKG